MLYCSWNTVQDGCNYFSFWAIFCPFTPLTAWKITIYHKRKKHLEISSFYISAPKIIMICYTAPKIWCMTDVIIIFHFGLSFALLPAPPPLPRPPLTSQRIKILKKWKKHLEISSFCIRVPKIMIRWCNCTSYILRYGLR